MNNETAKDDYDGPTVLFQGSLVDISRTRFNPIQSDPIQSDPG